MDLVANCKDKLAYFRIKELKDILTQLGLSKQGKKQVNCPNVDGYFLFFILDLVERILAILSDEQVSKMWAKKNAVGKDQVAKLVDDTYRKMQVSSGATDLASKGQGVSDSSNVQVKGETDDSLQLDTKVRCLCGNGLQTESMIKCEDPRCQVWQHISCVIVPEKPTEGNPPYPEHFYCEICRLNRADPFWVSVAHPLFPVKLITTMSANIPTDGTNPMQSVDRTFQLTRADKDLLSKQEYDVQAWCMLLNDKVPFRMQWPQYADLQINGLAVRAINRPGSQLLGANGRDDGPIITACTKDGMNKITLTGCDARSFCLGVRIVKRRTVQQILSMIPKDSEGERFQDALARICRCIGGGSTADNADSDSDLEVVAEFFGVNLRCPMSGSRMKIAGRFKPCAHMGCFDLEVFVELNQRSRKWQCPICLKNYALENVIIDPYFNRITALMRHCGEDVTEIEVKPDGSWRVRSKTESERRDLGDLCMWHSPEGIVCVSNEEVKPKMEALKQIKQEGGSDRGLKLGIRKNSNGVWEVSRTEDINTFTSGSRLPDNYGSHDQKIIPMSSSATGSRDGEDPSVNQDGGVNFDFSTNNGIELDSLSLNVDSTYGLTEQTPIAPVGEVIVLSDSDDDNNILISPGTVYPSNHTDAGEVPFSMPPSGLTDAYPEDPTLLSAGNSCLGLFNSHDDEFGMPVWLPPGTQGGAGFQLFSSDPDVSDALVDLQHNSINCSTMNGYAATQEAAISPASLVPGSSIGRTDGDINDSLVDNTLAFAGDDPSLQIFLPTRPSDAPMQSDFRDEADVSNGVHTEDWISLRLGGDAGGSNGESRTSKGLNSRQHIPSTGGEINSLSDTASLLLGMNDVRHDKASRQRSDSPFSFPRQKRSVRPRICFSIDSESE
ncbi:E3 SUMO-protein ligase SIZ1 isoform X1 [Benincasa hispida]|uniref:E3 SUMO-protein ligase SIZ1 isoform X1 n=2 Tax=Benincasa hispida TaxID=102211 RepID=UPI001902A21F|nr:E3 SUMO-protein ligase SIZ1 isoform X1 [Benincasa hispida]XP_038894175.1 E3 SUMO-protein ligase SIZ1 isoform X1 [Benincasa hispida]